jgi:2-iminobutanoate/2-iminopropanoate deaminase
MLYHAEEMTTARLLLIGSALGVGMLALIASQRVPARTVSAQETVQYLRRSGSTAPFSPVVRVGNVLYLSGQIGAGPDGRLPPEFGAQARQTMENVSATLKDAGSSYDDVFKCTVMLTDMSHWEEFNKIYVTYFKPERLPARSAIGASALARGAMIELECAAYRPAR